MQAIKLRESQINAMKYAYSQIKNEKARRHYLAYLAKDLGYGGISCISNIFGISRQMIRKGIKEIEAEGPYTEGRQRVPGAGRPSFEKQFARQMKENLQNEKYNYSEFLN